ncbi:hypothetical protein TNCV_2898071 [Trichonephila clavipes]|nr:hypothetical protein TNCV_2898071 [Trichonephila clavipes]
MESASVQGCFRGIGSGKEIAVPEAIVLKSNQGGTVESRRFGSFGYGGSSSEGIDSGKLSIRVLRMNTRNRWRDGQVCPDVDKELYALGQTTGDEERETRKKRKRGDPKGRGMREKGQGSPGERTRTEGREKSSEKKGWSVDEAERRIPEFFAR